MKRICRRSFLHRTTSGLLGWPLLVMATRAATTERKWRAAIIGASGRGDYGHGLDAVFGEFPSIEVVAVADPVTEGRERAVSRARAKRQYAHYQEMLAVEKPELVVLAPRWSEQRHAMAMAALDAGAHLLTEKPFTVTLAEADEILQSAREKRRKISVAHQMRLAPNVVHLKRALKHGAIGELVQMRSWGKQDRRAGGEDMLVLGTHLFDMMRLFAGDPTSCYARVFSEGRPITTSDKRSATEGIGPIAGDEIEATFQFPKGVTATFTSRGRLRESLAHWSVELIGTRGTVRILMDIDPRVLMKRRSEKSPLEIVEHWQPLPEDPALNLQPEQRGFGPANRRVTADWLESIERDREPQCSGYNGMKAIEMVMAVYESALADRPVSLPLLKRTHPLL